MVPRRRACGCGSGGERLGAEQAEDGVTPSSGSGYRGRGATRARGAPTGDLVVGLVQGSPDRQCRFDRRLTLGAGAALVGCTAWAVRRPGIVEVAPARRRPSRPGRALGQRSLLCRRRGRFIGSSTAGRRRERAALRHKPAEAFPLGRHQRLAITATVAGLVAVTLAVTPNPQASALARRAADEAVVTQACGQWLTPKNNSATRPLYRPGSFPRLCRVPVTARQGGYAHRLVGGIVRPFPAARRHGQLIRYSRAGGGSGRRGCRGHPGRGPRRSKCRPGPLEREPQRSRRGPANLGQRTAPVDPGAAHGAGRGPGVGPCRAAGSQAGNSEAGSSAPWRREQ